MRERLIEIQKRDGLTDGQMAERLGCSRPRWNMVKNGKRTFGEDMAVRAVGVWPELTRDLLDLAAASRPSPVVVTSTSENPASVARVA